MMASHRAPPARGSTGGVISFLHHVPKSADRETVSYRTNPSYRTRHDDDDSSICYTMSMEPDELYTLRAQFWLGHYGLSLDEAKAIARRPMSPALKAEREEFIIRANLALGQYDKIPTQGDTPATKALVLRAQFDQAINNDAKKAEIIDSLKALAASSHGDASTMLYASHVYALAGMTREALQCLSGASSSSSSGSSSMESLLMTLQLYLKIDRLDLAQDVLGTLKSVDEDSVLTQLGAAYWNIANGRSTASNALHILHSLQEQYGPSSLLVNAMATAQMVAGDFGGAESTLESYSSGVIDADTLVNQVVCYQHLGKPTGDKVQELKTQFPHHAFVQGLERVEGAFTRESVKYTVSA